MLFLISSGCEEKGNNPNPDISYFEVLAGSEDLPLSVPVVYSKVSEVEVSDLGYQYDTPIKMSEDGTMDNFIYQRVARPYTYNGIGENWFYNESAEVYADGDNRELRLYRVTKESKVYLPPKPDNSPVRIDSALENFISDSSEYIPIVVRPRNLPQYNIPLKPRAEARGTSEEAVVESDRQQAIVQRRSQLISVGNVAKTALENIGCIDVSVLPESGWVKALIPPDAINLLSTLNSIKVVTYTGSGDNIDNACNRGTSLKCSQTWAGTHGEPYSYSWPSEWYLGEAAKPERLDYQRYYDSGYYGSRSDLLLGVAEFHYLEDEGYFLKYTNGTSRLNNKQYSCNSTACTIDNDFPDEADSDPDHPTGVMSIAAGYNDPEQVRGHSLGDSCYYYNWFYGDYHCGEFITRSRGMAPYANISFYKIESTDPYDNDTAVAYQKAIDNGVDVLNLSHGRRDFPTTICDPMINFPYEETLENAFDQGVFVVNSTGNYGFADTCTVNGRSSKPKVFSVGGLLNSIYRYGDFSSDWETGYTSSLYPQSPDDYHEMRRVPNGVRTGGADLVVNDSTMSRALSVVDLLAPEGGFRVTNADENIYNFFRQSSGAAPHVSGLAMLVKQWLLSSGQSWVNSPGRLHTVMLGMGDRYRYTTSSHSFSRAKTGSDRKYGMGRIKLRLFANTSHGTSPNQFGYSMHTYSWNSASFSGSSYKLYRQFTYKTKSQASIIKCVFNQDEDMTNKDINNMTSDFIVGVVLTNSPPSGICPYTYDSSEYYTARYDFSHNVKKLITFDNSDNYTLSDKCVYLYVYKRNIISTLTSHAFCYYAGVNDDEF